jgi:hypothetical protein
LPVLGIPILALGPKNPSSQSSNKIIIIVSSIISLYSTERTFEPVEVKRPFSNLFPLQTGVLELPMSFHGDST